MADENELEGLDVVDELPDGFDKSSVDEQLKGKVLEEDTDLADSIVKDLLKAKSPNLSSPEAEKTEKPLVDAGEELPEYKNIPDLLNKYFDAGLNEEVINGLNEKDSAKITVQLFEKVINDSNKALDEYEHIEKMLEEDKDLKQFIEFRKKGGSLEDLVKQYGNRVDLSDEDLVRQDIKNKFKVWTDEEVEEQLDLYKDSNKLKKIADSLRKLSEDDSKIDLEKINKQKEEEEKKVRETQYQEYLKDVSSYEKYLVSKKDVEGIPLTDEMKNNILALAVGKDKKTNTTYLETALQSDEGVLLAALGILYLPTLIKAGQSIATNKSNKKLFDKLLDKPDQLQSSKKGTQLVVNDVDIANAW